MEFAREWALKWVEGVLLGFARNRIELNRALGMLRRAKDYGVSVSDILSIIEVIENSPAYLPSMTQKEKKLKFKQIRDALKV